ncbi:MAG: DUF4342 domain-containing protein [Clostridiaceae bacterium]|jgi:hypothetical protein|nr:DUF4342 domain-containing protein [Clostridiaceae bacterium]
MITIEQIDEFRKRTHSSYEDAKYYLEKNNGDILDAIIDFERSKPNKSHSHQNKKQQEDFGKNFADILQKGFDTRIFIEDKNSTLFSVPVILLILFIPLWVPVLILGILLLVLGYKFSVRDVKSQNVNVNNIFRNINEKMKESSGNKNSSKARSGNTETKTEDTGETPVNGGKTSALPEISGSLVPDKQKPDTDDDEGYKEYTIE